MKHLVLQCSDASRLAISCEILKSKLAKEWQRTHASDLMATFDLEFHEAYHLARREPLTITEEHLIQHSYTLNWAEIEPHAEWLDDDLRALNMEHEIKTAAREIQGAPIKVVRVKDLEY